MINNDLLVKIAMEVDKSQWPDIAFEFRQILENIKRDSLIGLNDNCLSLINKDQIKPGDFIVLSRAGVINSNRVPNPYIVITVDDSCSSGTIYSVGSGIESDIDNLDLIRPDKSISLDSEQFSLSNDGCIFFNQYLRIDARPTNNGGPGYYYYFKCPRDLRLK